MKAQSNSNARLLPQGVHEFLREMSSLFAIYLYTMGSREYVQQVRRGAYLPRSYSVEREACGDLGSAVFKIMHTVYA